MNTISTTKLPKKCWIYTKKRYIAKTTLPELPFTYPEYEDILKAHNIPYRKFSKYLYDGADEATEICEYWSPEAGLKEEDLTLPLYVRLPDGSFRYAERNHTQKIPTAETIKAAKEIQKLVITEVEEYKEKLRKLNACQFAKEQLEGRIATVCISTNTPYRDCYNANINGDNFKILRISGFLGFLSDWVAIFDMNKIVPNGYITLQVPTAYAGSVIGKSGSNIQAWAQEIGVKKIQVVPI